MSGSVIEMEAVDLLRSSMMSPPVIVDPRQGDSELREFTVYDLRVWMEVARQETIGCSLQRLTVWPTRPIRWDARRVGEAIAKRVTCLLEPLRLVEAIPERGYVQVRSARPWRGDGHIEYYELTTAGSGDGRPGLSLKRYRTSKGVRGRTAMPMNMTWEVLTRLLEELSAVLSAEKE
jgi:hypothetical protein